MFKGLHCSYKNIFGLRALLTLFFTNDNYETNWLRTAKLQNGYENYSADLEIKYFSSSGPQSKGDYDQITFAPVVDMMTLVRFTIASREGMSPVSAMTIGRSLKLESIAHRLLFNSCNALILLPAIAHLNLLP